MPDLKATELSGPDGEPLIEPTRREELWSAMETARRFAFVLASGTDARNELDEMGPETIDMEPEPTPEPQDAHMRKSFKEMRGA